jgi:phosphate starvation-inducible membrane PsiE
MTLSLSLSPSLSFSMQIQIIRLCSLYSLASSLDSRVIFGLYRPFRAFLMMYFDSDIHMTMECTYS